MRGKVKTFRRYDISVYETQQDYDEYNGEIVFDNISTKRDAMRIGKNELSKGYAIVKVQSDDREYIELLKNEYILPKTLSLGVETFLGEDAQIIMETGEHICKIERSPSKEIAEEIIRRYNTFYDKKRKR